MPKLLASADYAENHGGRFVRIDALAADKPDDPLRRRDLLDASVREGIRKTSERGSQSRAYSPANTRSRTNGWRSHHDPSLVERGMNSKLRGVVTVNGWAGVGEV